MRIKMIVTDLDNTLLQSDKSISPYTKEIISYCQTKGILLAFATARSEKACVTYAKQVHPCAVISNSGALVRKSPNDYFIYRKTMSKEITNALLSLCLNQFNLGLIAVDTDDGYLVSKPVDPDDPSWADYLPASHTDFSQGLSSDSYKIAAEVFDYNILNVVKNNFPIIRVVPFSGEHWVCFSDEHANKLNGVKALVNHFHISLDEVVAFGDDFSDIEMLRGCGIGVAMGNAIPEVKAVADEICEDNNQDGVAKWLKKHIL